jgi:D-alanyl-D-alanine carboxypeptidase
MKHITSILFGGLLFACSNEIIIPQPQASEDVSYDTHPKHLQYQRELEKYKNDTYSPGSILLVDKPGEPLWLGATGDSNLEYKNPMKTTNQFRTGSITKMFTAVVIMRMVEEHLLSLEDKLINLLPETSGNIEKADRITLRHLLSHLSGIIDPPNESLNYQAEIINNPKYTYDMSIEKMLDKYVYGKNLHFEPGTGYSYSNTNYWLLGLIAERKSGQTLQVLMNNYIFTPIALPHTYIEKRDDRNVARGYVDFYNNGKLMDVSQWDRAEGDGQPDGGLITNAEELNKFMRALFRGQLVSLTTLEEMKKIQLPGCNSPECEYGLGLELWRTDAGIAYGHNGSLAGLEANALYYEETGGISVLYKNNGNFSDKRFLDQLMK